VYKCLRKSDELILAIKVIPFDGGLSEGDTGVASLKREIEILQECKCDWVVSYHGCYYLVRVSPLNPFLFFLPALLKLPYA
jgi:hypothetical protein